eukprot:gene24587-biopygen1392
MGTFKSRLRSQHSRCSRNDNIARARNHNSSFEATVLGARRRGVGRDGWRPRYTTRLAAGTCGRGARTPQRAATCTMHCPPPGYPGHS